MQNRHHSIWWGPPRKFSNRLQDRKISWLELFFDLVYAVVISKTTRGLAVNSSVQGITDYAYFIIIIFWGWYNGSQYHDLHGTTGIRTRMITLWQMMIVAGLAVTFNSPAALFVGRATVAIAVLQLYITYLWWSVGIYDKEHRNYNLPYTVCYLLAFVFIILTLFLPQPYKRVFFWLILLLNYTAPFIASGILKRNNAEFSLSASMIERLGLFTIIVFGEAILGVVNGMNLFNDFVLVEWICFGLGILIVFSLWWIFFSLIADREAKKGFTKGSLVAMVYILTLASLGVIGAAFPGLMNDLRSLPESGTSISRLIYGFSIALFLLSIVLISRFLVYPNDYHKIKPKLQTLIVAIGLIVLSISVFMPLALIWYLLVIFLLLLSIIVIITMGWFRLQLRLQELK